MSAGEVRGSEMMVAKKPKLKVFTAPVGFHDVYVAAPSRAAALRAWGSDHDLFARGVASEVTDPDLTEEPLAHPGEVIRRLRGTEAEQFAALPKEVPIATKASARKHTAAEPIRSPLPRPSRKALDAAEAALTAAQTRHHEEDDAARKKLEEAQRQRRDLQHRNAAEARDLDAVRDDARDRYEHELNRWRERQ